MRSKQLLVRGVEIVTFLFAAFGHFLLNVAPPEEGRLRISIGIASVLTLGLLLYISALARALPARTHKRAWLIAAGSLLAVVIVALPWYRSNLGKYTFAYPAPDSPSSFVRGSELWPKAAAYWKSNPHKTVQDIVGDFGGPGARTVVWTEASIQSASTILGIHYLVVVLSLTSALFCLTEGFAGRAGSPARRRPKRTDTERSRA
jgi:hypothetical protein